MDLADYVLSRFSKKTGRPWRMRLKEAAKAVEVMITEGMDTAMNQFNGHKA